MKVKKGFRLVLLSNLELQIISYIFGNIVQLAILELDE